MPEPRTTLPDATDTEQPALVDRTLAEDGDIVDVADSARAGSEHARDASAGARREQSDADVQAQAAGLADDLWAAWQTASQEWTSARRAPGSDASDGSASVPGSDGAHGQVGDHGSPNGTSGESGTRTRVALLEQLLDPDGLDLVADVLESAAVGVRAFASNLTRLREQRAHRSQ